MTRDELQALLETPLDPNLDYYDATKSIEAMANHVRDLHKLVNFMFETLALQGGSIIDLRKHVVAQKEAIEALANMLSPAGENPFQPLPPAPDRPKIIGIKKKLN
jgi:hypothetical protein